MTIDGKRRQQLIVEEYKAMRERLGAEIQDAPLDSEKWYGIDDPGSVDGVPGWTYGVNPQPGPQPVVVDGKEKKVTIKDSWSEYMERTMHSMALKMENTMRAIDSIRLDMSILSRRLLDHQELSDSLSAAWENIQELQEELEKRDHDDNRQ